MVNMVHSHIRDLDLLNCFQQLNGILIYVELIVVNKYLFDNSF